MADDDPKAPPSDPPGGVSRPTLEAFLALDATQDLILRVVLKRLRPRAPEFLVDDLVSEANFACLTAQSLPRDEKTMGSWVVGVTAITIHDWFRTNARYAKHLDPEADVEAIVAEIPEEPDTDVDGWMLDAWLETRVKTARDRETLELIRYKARTGKTDEQVCADKKLTLSALRSRVHYFKKKHHAALQRHKVRMAERDRLIWLVLKWGAGLVVGAIVVAVVVWALWKPKLEIQPLPPAPVPSASASSDPTRDIAQPPDLEPPDGSKPK
jgi:DNA-directed RNA polymerase specialized sigma24 family protein